MQQREIKSMFSIHPTELYRMERPDAPAVREAYDRVITDTGIRGAPYFAENVTALHFVHQVAKTYVLMNREPPEDCITEEQSIALFDELGVDVSEVMGVRFELRAQKGIPLRGERFESHSRNSKTVQIRYSQPVEYRGVLVRENGTRKETVWRVCEPHVISFTLECLMLEVVEKEIV